MNSAPLHQPLQTRLPRYTSGQAALSRLLGTTNKTSDCKGWQLSIDTIAAPPCAPLVISLSSAVAQAEIIIDGVNYPALYAIGHEPAPDRRITIANLWLANALETLSKMGLPEARVTALRTGASALSTDGVRQLTLRMRSSKNAEPLACTVADVHWHQQPPVPHAPAEEVLQRCGALQLPARIRIASRRCRADILLALQPGDVLIGWGDAPYDPTTDAGNVRLFWGATRHTPVTTTACYEEGIVTLADIPRPQDETEDRGAMPIVSPDSGAESTLHIGALEVPVHLEVAIMGMQLAELAALQPGHVLQLPERVNHATVRLVCHGQTLGHGTLVAVGEQLGLEISAMGAGNAEH